MAVWTRLRLIPRRRAVGPCHVTRPIASGARIIRDSPRSEPVNRRDARAPNGAKVSEEQTKACGRTLDPRAGTRDIEGKGDPAPPVPIPPPCPRSIGSLSRFPVSRPAINAPAPTMIRRRYIRGLSCDPLRRCGTRLIAARNAAPATKPTVHRRPTLNLRPGPWPSRVTARRITPASCR